MASGFFLIVLLVLLVSIHVTSFKRERVLKKYDEESYSRASSEQVPSKIDRSLQGLVAVNKRSSRGKSWIKNQSKVGSLDVLTFVVIIILAVIATIVIIGVLFGVCITLKTKITQSIGQGEVGAKEVGHETEEKTETVTISPQAGNHSNGDVNV